MIYETTTKDIVSLEPQARINDSAAVCSAADRRGFDFAVVKLLLGANDVGLTVCKLQESNDNSTWTDIPGTDYTTDGTPPGGSDQNKLYIWDVDLRGRMRYLRPALTVGDGTNGAFLAVLVSLGRAEHSPKDATSRGAAQVLSV